MTFRTATAYNLTISTDSGPYAGVPQTVTARYEGTAPGPTLAFTYVTSGARFLVRPTEIVSATQVG